LTNPVRTGILSMDHPFTLKQDNPSNNFGIQPGHHKIDTFRKQEIKLLDFVNRVHGTEIVLLHEILFQHFPQRFNESRAISDLDARSLRLLETAPSSWARFAAFCKINCRGQIASRST